ncbi:MAG: hypothetical protein AB2A00_38660 [Myxococcota bacterium]
MLATSLYTLTLLLSPPLQTTSGVTEPAPSGVTLISEFVGEGSLNVVVFPELEPPARRAPPPSLEPTGAELTTEAPSCEACPPCPMMSPSGMAVRMESGYPPCPFGEVPLYVQYATP